MFELLYELKSPSKNVVSWGVPGRLDMSGEGRALLLRVCSRARNKPPPTRGLGKEEREAELRG